MMSPVAYWKRNTARNSFYFLCALEGWIVTLFGTYVTNQLQTIGLVIGTDTDGGPCITSCTVLMGTQPLQLQKVLSYLTAMILGLGGFVALNLVFFADFWMHKSLLITGGSAIFAIFAIPVYWLTAPTVSNFNSLFALSVIVNIMTTLFLILVAVYIPHCMRAVSQTYSEHAASVEDISPNLSSAAYIAETRRSYGFAMSVWGIVFCSGAAALAQTLSTILSNKAPDSNQNVGLMLTTISGFLTLVGIVGCYFGLPSLPARKWSSGVSNLVDPIKALVNRKNALWLLMSYTIYTNVLFALFGNIFQVYYTQATPSAVESSVYSVVSTILSTSTYIAYFFVQRQFRFNLEKCLLFGYAFTLIPEIWGAIGMSRQENFGEKHDWEFWVVMVVFQLGGSIVNSTWRFLIAELIPAGDEFLWFGMQGVLFCATTWINSVATTPLQSQTNIRFPLILCIVFSLIPIAMEALRIYLSFFKEDKIKWQNLDELDDSRTNSFEDKVHGEKASDTNPDRFA